MVQELVPKNVHKKQRFLFLFSAGDRLHPHADSGGSSNPAADVRAPGANVQEVGATQCAGILRLDPGSGSDIVG